MNKLNGGEGQLELLDLFEIFLEGRHLHAVFAAHLLHNQFGIKMAYQTVGMVALCDLQSFNKSTVLGDVIRFDSYVLVMLPDNLPPLKDLL